MKCNTSLKQLILILLIFTISAYVCFGQASLCGDIDGSGEADIIDALLIAQCYVGQILNVTK